MIGWNGHCPSSINRPHLPYLPPYHSCTPGLVTHPRHHHLATPSSDASSSYSSLCHRVPVHCLTGYTLGVIVTSTFAIYLPLGHLDPQVYSIRHSSHNHPTTYLTPHDIQRHRHVPFDHRRHFPTTPPSTPRSSSAFALPSSALHFAPSRLRTHSAAYPTRSL